MSHPHHHVRSYVSVWLVSLLSLFALLYIIIVLICTPLYHYCPYLHTFNVHKGWLPSDWATACAQASFGEFDARSKCCHHQCPEHGDRHGELNLWARNGLGSSPSFPLSNDNSKNKIFVFGERCSPTLLLSGDLTINLRVWPLHMNFAFDLCVWPSLFTFTIDWANTWSGCERLHAWQCLVHSSWPSTICKFQPIESIDALIGNQHPEHRTCHSAFILRLYCFSSATRKFKFQTPFRKLVQLTLIMD